MFQDYRVAYLREHVKVKEEQRFSFLRQGVAYMLSMSARNIPHAAMITHFDCTPLVEYTRSGEESIGRDKDALTEDALFRRAIRRNYSAFFVKAIAHSLHHTPCMNGFIDYTPWRNGGTLYRAEDINLSFTVHTKYGVIKPIVRNAHQKDLETVSKEMHALTRKARRTDPERLYHAAARTYIKTALRQCDLSGLLALWIWLRAVLFSSPKPDPTLKDVPPEDQLAVEDILGATCTVANIGMVVRGNQTVTVIIPPEVMMFGIGDLRLEPRVVNGEVVPRYVITVTGTMDHRAFDAGEAFPFYNHIKNYIDHPELIYEWKPGDPI
ncbi:MAG: 2-oxo acid dehydrogenase subunit E2 [Candidatus Hydrogenedentes bacterium]|nr:2-oxo acid dehydrogenase subunit E2 [Candidatus Hydrogenedentota bacterium]